MPEIDCMCRQCVASVLQVSCSALQWFGVGLLSRLTVCTTRMMPEIDCMCRHVASVLQVCYKCVAVCCSVLGGLGADRSDDGTVSWK